LEEPNEKVLPAAARKEAKGDSGIGGIGTSWADTSVEDGRVEEELYLAEEELS
jgi:hypothetical protein